MGLKRFPLSSASLKSITDVMMPGGMNGRQLADAARQRRPNLKVLFSSGYFQGALENKEELEMGVHFLVKPYRKMELAQRIEEILNSTL